MRQSIVMLIVVIIHTLPNIDHVMWTNMATISDGILATNFVLLTIHLYFCCIMGRTSTPVMDEPMNDGDDVGGDLCIVRHQSLRVRN